MADHLVARIPFEYEKNADILQVFENEITETEVPDYLNSLSQRLSEKMNLAEGMDIQVHYLNDSMVNAFATLGGQISITRGLLERLPNENALAMVLAHEIAHIKMRHPLRSLGRGMVISIAIQVLSNSSGNSLSSFVVGETGVLTSLKFSRAQEQEADKEGLQAVVALYGHANGSKTLFQVLLDEENTHPLQAETIEFMNTHPLSQERIRSIENLARKEHWSLTGKTTRLPEFIPRKQVSDQ